jgi:hypothetical protein
MTFRTTLLLAGKTATGFVVPPEVVVRRRFEALSYSNQLRHVLAVDGAKTAGTRERRVAKVVESLRVRS